MEVIPFKITIDNSDQLEVLKAIGAIQRALEEEQRAWEKNRKTVRDQGKEYKQTERAARDSSARIAKTLDETIRRINQLELLPRSFNQEAVLQIQKLKEFLEQIRDIFKESGPTDVDKDTWWEKLGAQEKHIEKAYETIKKGLEKLDELFKKSMNNRKNEAKAEEERRIASLDNLVLSEEEKEQRIANIKKESAEKQQNLEREYKRKQKKIQLAQAIISTSVGVTQALGGSPPPANFIQAAIVAAMGAVEIATIAKQKFAQGGVIPFAQGGAIQGATHAQGGVPFMAAGRLMEAEGGELIVNRNIWTRPDLVHAISEMNAATGGRRFYAGGGVVPSPAVPAMMSSTNNPPGGSWDMEGLIQGLRGVIAEEVGSLQVTNNVVDTSSQQINLQNQQVYNSF